jgi:hypothetical protein
MLIRSQEINMEIPDKNTHHFDRTFHNPQWLG